MWPGGGSSLTDLKVQEDWAACVFTVESPTPGTRKQEETNTNPGFTPEQGPWTHLLSPLHPRLRKELKLLLFTASPFCGEALNCLDLGGTLSSSPLHQHGVL